MLETPNLRNKQGKSTRTRKWLANYADTTLTELKIQRGITIPLVAMNLTLLAKMVITTVFLGRLGELKLAGGALGLTFANVTGFSVLNGLCGAMEPICGQAFGAKNFKLLHKTLLMTTFLLLFVTVPISFLWLHVDKVLVYFGQQEEISAVAKTFLFYLLPDLVVISFLCPLKSYLSSQTSAVPIMLGSALALALHVPITIFLSKWKGLEGVSMAIWMSDLVVVILLAVHLCFAEDWNEGGWFEQGRGEWIRLVKLSMPCCLTTCLEWWCYEILVLLTGRLENPKQALGVITIVLNFDYLLYSVMLSLATCASTRVSNELGANSAGQAHRSARVLLAVGLVSGCVGGLVMVSARGSWGSLFSREKGVVNGVKKMMLVMALVEIVNFPLAICGGIVRGTARPWLAMYANLGGFYLLALPLGVGLGFKVRLGLGGLLIGFFMGTVVSLVLLLVFVLRIDWDEEARKAQELVRHDTQDFEETKEANHKTVDAVDNGHV